MPFFERYLSVWVALCIVVGILMGRFIPGLFESLGSMEIARVNLPVAVLIWLMILPMLLKSTSTPWLKSGSTGRALA